MVFSLNPLFRLRMRLSQAGRFSNRVSLKIGSLSILLLGISLCGCDSKPVTGPVDPGSTLGGSDEPVSEADMTEEQPVSTDAAAKPTATDSNATDATDKEPAMSNTDGKLLRHAVFFSFNEDSTDENIAGVTTAFAALPSKIESIVDFQWGTNNSPENLDDGFTHGFLLTFKDEAGREVYLPHPAHTGEFADTLRPHMKDVFVIDYWGTPHQNEIKKELKHAVFFKFKDDADPVDVKKVEQAFAALPEKIDSIKAFEWGTNNSPESHDDGFTHCFMVTFDSEEGREVYLPHPEHLAFVEVLKPVLDKVRVIDFWAQ